MALHEVGLLNANVAPDDSGDVFFERAEEALTLDTATFGSLLGVTIGVPSADIGLYGKFTVPQNYDSGTAPLIVVRGINQQASNILAFGFQKLAVADNETVEAAWDAQQIASATVSHAVEDLYVETIALTGADYAAGDEVFFFFFRDDSVDTQTAAFFLTGLAFRYDDGV